MTAYRVVSPQLLLVLSDLFESHLWQLYLAILRDAGCITAERFDSLRSTINRIRSECTDSRHADCRIRLRLARHELTPAHFTPLPAPTIYTPLT